MQRHDFAFELPPELIAQAPLAERSASRLLVVRAEHENSVRSSAGASASASASDGASDGASASADACIGDLPGLLNPGDLLVFNDTKVVAARLAGVKPSGGRVEIFLERIVSTREALAQLRASKPIREGLEVSTAGGVVRVAGRQGDLWRVEFPGPALEFFERWGEVPLPPYIHRAADEKDRERYQSIFARESGAVAAPTASLHFDPSLAAEIEARGVNRAFVTLHVGAGTFQPIRTDDLDSHVMHAERAFVSAETCAAIERTRAAGGRVIAVGTTVVRALESAALACAAGDSAGIGIPPERATPDDAAKRATSRAAEPTASGTAAKRAASSIGANFRGPPVAIAPCLPVAGWSGETRIFIRPGFQFRVTDALLTNFHLPESTLLMLVCAFAGTASVMAAYRHAVEARYRFFSYGDAMFLTCEGFAE